MTRSQADLTQALSEISEKSANDKKELAEQLKAVQGEIQEENRANRERFERLEALIHQVIKGKQALNPEGTSATKEAINPRSVDVDSGDEDQQDQQPRATSPVRPASSGSRPYGRTDRNFSDFVPPISLEHAPLRAREPYPPPLAMNGRNRRENRAREPNFPYHDGRGRQFQQEREVEDDDFQEEGYNGRGNNYQGPYYEGGYRDNGRQGHQGGMPPQMTKMNFPKFKGGEALEWVEKAEAFFIYQDTPPDQWVRLAVFHLEGEAYQWTKWFQRGRRRIRWEEFVDGFCARFGPLEYANFDALLSKLRQTGTFDEYRAEFECLANRVDWEEKALLGCFISGLKDFIREEVQAHQPRSVRGYSFGKIAG